MNETYIRLIGPITPEFSNRLLQIVSRISDENHTARLHLLLSIPGGSVSLATTIYNALRKSGLEIYTYNLAVVDSTGILIYSAGKVRFADQVARFLIHELSMPMMGLYTARELTQYRDQVKSENLNYARIVAETAGQPLKKVLSDMENQTFLDAEQAKNYGLVHDIQPVPTSGIHENIFASPTPAALMGWTNWGAVG